MQFTGSHNSEPETFLLSKIPSKPLSDITENKNKRYEDVFPSMIQTVYVLLLEIIFRWLFQNLSWY